MRWFVRQRGSRRRAGGLASRAIPTRLALATAAALMTFGWPADSAPPEFPTVVFVSRNPLPRTIAPPGLGPRLRLSAAGGRLMACREPGKPRPLAPAIDRRFFDVSGPAPSPDGKRIAFAGKVAPDSAWRVFTMQWECNEQGLQRVPVAEAAGAYDDVEPCWLDDATLLFVSTRDGGVSEYDRTPVGQLFRFDFDTGRLTRVTAERNGVGTPAVDPRSGRIVYSRWWFNRVRPDSATTDTVNLWQAISIAADGTNPRAIALRPGERRLSSLTEPAIAADGTLYGVVGDALGLSPAPGATEITMRASSTSAPVHIAGARFDPEDAPRYGSTRGLASPSAHAPAVLPDGRIVYALDPGGRGEYGVWVANRDGTGALPFVDLPGTIETDPAVWAVRSVPRAPRPAFSLPLPPPDARALERWPVRFRFTNRDVFGAGYGSREDERARRAGPVRIRFQAALPRAGAAHGDTLVLVRESRVSPTGRVDERDLPAGIPMFEQLVDAQGRVLRSAHGPAHVAGYNAGLPGRTSNCVGCHVGHSIAR